MKTAIHPEYMITKVHCESCGIDFESTSTVPAITVEICSACHPFYTGKQKILDTAGRVEKFNTRRATADKLQSKAAKAVNKKEDPEVAKIQDELESETTPVETPEAGETVEASEVEATEAVEAVEATETTETTDAQQ